MASKDAETEIQEPRSLEPVRSLKDLEYQFMPWMSALSGTVRNGQYHNHTADDSRTKPPLGMSGAALKSKAEANIRHRVVPLISEAVTDRWSVNRFMSRIPRQIHHGLPEAKIARSIRRHETGNPYGCPVPEVQGRWDKFRVGLQKRLTAGLRQPEQANPWLLVAATEWYVRFRIHPIGDGCGRLSTATSFWIMLLFGDYPPFPIFGRKEFHEEMRHGADNFIAFYLANCFPRTMRNRPDSEAIDPFAELFPDENFSAIQP